MVKKTYHMAHADIFQYEVEALRKLQGCKFVPRLLCVDMEKRTIYMSYCGKPINNFAHYRQKIKNYVRVMEEEYGVYHNDIREGNICLNQGQIYFIDFGWARDKPGVGGYGKGKLGDPKLLDSKGVVPKVLKNNIFDITPKRTTRQELLNVLLSIHVSNELQSEYLKQNVNNILQRENMLAEKSKDNSGVVNKVVSKDIGLDLEDHSSVGYEDEDKEDDMGHGEEDEDAQSEYEKDDVSSS